MHGFVGWSSRQVGSVPVGRPQDAARPAKGTIYMPDPLGDPTLLRGVGTDFVKEAEVDGIVFLPSMNKQSGASMEIAEVLGPEELRIKRPPKGRNAMVQLTGRDDVDEHGGFKDKEQRGIKEGHKGTKFKLAPHIDQTKVYEAVFARLTNGGCVGLFPEGGSHDRTELLPLKAGIAIMALGTLARAPDCGLKIVPVGMNYFHAHKFRSRAVIEFGPPFEVAPELVHMYSHGKRRDAIGQLLDTVYNALSAVTVSTPDYDTLMLIQAARRLYNPTGRKLPLPVVVELNRRLALGYDRYKDDERIVQLTAAVKDYNKRLRYVSLRDHQVQYATLSLATVVWLLVTRVIRLIFLGLLALPGTVLFSPIFVACKVISIRKARAALAASSVKIQGRDVMATWKLMVGLVAAPVSYALYATLVAYKTYTDRLWGLVPPWMPIWLVWILTWPVAILITVAALQFGERGMDIFKSLRPLFICLNPSSSYSIRQLRELRAELSERVTDIINTLGPEMFPDFEHTRLVHPEPHKNHGAATEPGSLSPTRSRFFSTDSLAAASSAAAAQTAGAPASPTTTSRRRDSEQSAGGVASSPSRRASATDHVTPPSIIGALSRRSTTQSSRAMPRNESFSNIGTAEVFSFSTRPPSRDSAVGRSRSSSGPGFPVAAMTTLDSKEGFEEASKKIREAMRERGEMRYRRRSEQHGKKGLVVDIGEDEDEGEDEEDEEDEGEYVEVKKRS